MRPEYKALAARCPSCGAPLSVPDERAQLVVCSSCDSHLSLDGPTRDVLRLLRKGGSGRAADYQLELGQSFHQKGARYEVIAREHWVEEQDLRYSTRVYTLYHPRRSLLFLDCYQGTWTLMQKVHVMPVGDVTQASSMRTHDGRRWQRDEVVYPELIHVDGCLPWVSRVGQQVTEAEFSSGKLRYVVEDSGEEQEFFAGHVLSPKELRRAMPDAEVRAKSPGASLSERKARAHTLVGLGVLGALGHVMVVGFALTQGSTVLAQQFRAEDLPNEVTSQPFVLHTGLARIDLEAPLDDAWMAVDVALIEGEDSLIHVTDADISYYSGVEGGESWSEGSRSSEVLLRVPHNGQYRLLVHAISNTGETETASSARHDLVVRVTDHARSPFWGGAGLVFSVLFGALGLAWSKMLSEE